MTTLRPGAEHVDAAWLAQRLPATSSKDLGHGLARLIDGGELPPGAHLPTIRDFARAAGVSPGTVMTAWSRVRDSGRLHTRRRGGTVVADLHRPAPAAHPTVGWSHIEMALVAPDPALQPDLGPALAEGLRGTPDLHNPERAYISDRLRRSVEGSWPFDAQAWNCVGGGSEAVVLATAAAASGGPIGVEEPVSPGYLDVLRQLGIEAIGVRADEHGPTVASVRSAVRAGATALVLQPSGAYAVAGALSTGRAAELAAAVGPHTWVVEDDSAGPLAATEPASLGVHLPDRVLRIRSYCKAFGIDLRSAVLGGSAELIERTVRLRSFGMASNSRVLQNALAHLIVDPDTELAMTRARSRYRLRRHGALAAFTAAGLHASASPDGFVVWVRVPDETSALINLARQGIVAAAGAKSFVTTGEPLLRFSVLQLPEDRERVDDLAAAVRAAVNSADREYFD
ncbi:aminotransferase class I/II-fold pyridoxal phosphate-dependent enzyme [Mycolicibacterium vaccae]|uniref:GntR family transcriptional regulator n=1 Tax=Mycolicibacterium vaccae ATCC 25954 TaxID=1194972 RepID=K0VIU3_MYCVA|nr:aminotransferase class I/II-fold pyridoxal phosphate-dependent enzyme [Mycolicibacterium vaccae]ANI38230.1 GntR family transcriptional regulator [Mycolicibacterium vaccae 95051]EJZ10989.1 GntR family transcriptional regulator [Mycolicibacterium vaccae ATCC 25954]